MIMNMMGGGGPCLTVFYPGFPFMISWLSLWPCLGCDPVIPYGRKEPQQRDQRVRPRQRRRSPGCTCSANYDILFKAIKVIKMMMLMVIKMMMMVMMFTQIGSQSYLLLTPVGPEKVFDFYCILQEKNSYDIPIWWYDNMIMWRCDNMMIWLYDDIKIVMLLMIIPMTPTKSNSEWHLIERTMLESVIMIIIMKVVWQSWWGRISGQMSSSKKINLADVT